MADVYEIITARIISQLESGTVPWHKPWNVGPHGGPQNLVSKKGYRGVNVFLLSCMPYTMPYWVSYKQAQQLGGHVRKGEKSTPVVFWKWLEKENLKTGKPDKIPLLRYYRVFNVSQCDGIDGKIPQVDEQEVESFEPIAECERIVETMPDRPDIRHGMDGGFYQPSNDFVGMPDRERFDSPESYYSTLFHELTHSTGHTSRLNRKGIVTVAGFGSQTYSKEELVAEMGASFLSGHVGIEADTIDNSASYIASWLKRLRDDKKLVVQAAAQAQKAVDFIRGIKWEGGAK